MPGALDVTGQRYGRLVALRLDGIKLYPSGQKRRIWLFRCDCGNEAKKTLFDVRRTDTKSCGCLKHSREFVVHNKLPRGEASFNGLYSHYKQSARDRNIEWGLDKDIFRALTQALCHYCGQEPSQEHLTHATANGVYIYNGIDRVDNKKGYVPKNVVACCSVCNRAKQRMEVRYFLAWAERVYLHSVKENGK